MSINKKLIQMTVVLTFTNTFQLWYIGIFWTLIFETERPCFSVKEQSGSMRRLCTINGNVLQVNDSALSFVFMLNYKLGIWFGFDYI